MTVTAFRPGIWVHEAIVQERPSIPWLWQGFLAPGRISLLTSLWKSGKTTLVSLLLARLQQGGALAGQSVGPGMAAVISEEDIDLWTERARSLGFASKVCFFCQPFDAKPSLDAWVQLIDHLVDLRRSHSLDLVVVDPLASFLPGRDENHAALMIEALQPLRRLTRAGLAVLLLHHPRKGLTQPGQAARGSGALSAFVDISIEMTHVPAAPQSRRRLLFGYSRFRETPRRLLVELNPEHTDYAVLPEEAAGDDDFHAHWDVLRMVLEDAKTKLTRRDILAAWPPDFPPPPDSTLWSWLRRAGDLGLLRAQGTGRKNDPFRYWLPSQEAKWQSDPLALVLQSQEWLKAEIDKLDRK